MNARPTQAGSYADQAALIRRLRDEEDDRASLAAHAYAAARIISDPLELVRLTKVARLDRPAARRIAAVLPLASAQAFLAEHADLTGYVPGQEHQVDLCPGCGTDADHDDDECPNTA